MCGRRGSRLLPDAVSPMVGWRAEKEPGVALPPWSSPAMPSGSMSTVRLGSSSTWRFLGALLRMVRAPAVESVGLKRMVIWPFAEPVKIWLSLGCQLTVMSGEPGVTGVTSSGRSVAGFKMCRWPVSEPVMMLAELGANWMFDVGYCDDVEGCDVVLSGVLNLRVSHSLMVSSPPLVMTNLPSALISSPLVQVSLTCASRISAVGRWYGPSPPHMTRLPSSAADTRMLLPPSAAAPQATAVILVIPALPAARDLCTMTSSCFMRFLTSQMRTVLSVPAVTNLSRFVGCHAALVRSAVCPFVLCLSLRYISPLTYSAVISPSLLNSRACGVAETHRNWLPESGLIRTWWMMCASAVCEGLVANGSTVLNARIVLGVSEGRSCSLTVQSKLPVTMRLPEGSSAMDVTARSWVLTTSSWVTGNSSSSSSESSSLSSSESLSSFVLPCLLSSTTGLRHRSICAAMSTPASFLPNWAGINWRSASSSSAEKSIAHVQ
ncbi:hypothetical protein B5807_10181 [Epicoccum nigrum]|uniref:Uncharacterized protein n=1 Tax=Epicoccum nigrum TaxID=105696 RepID=A0A1Y2LNR2_EPING|nr:hypothetical protein B5807_10181 [Epicoccum nigrum]